MSHIPGFLQPFVWIFVVVAMVALSSVITSGLSIVNNILTAIVPAIQSALLSMVQFVTWYFTELGKGLTAVFSNLSTLAVIGTVVVVVGLSVQAKERILCEDKLSAQHFADKAEYAPKTVAKKPKVKVSYLGNPPSKVVVPTPDKYFPAMPLRYYK